MLDPIKSYIHDMNNKLQIIIQNQALAVRRNKDPFITSLLEKIKLATDSSIEILDEIRTAIKRVSQSDEGAQGPEGMSMESFVDWIRQRKVHWSTLYHIELQLNIERIDQQVFLLLSEKKLVQVFDNLIENCYHADATHVVLSIKETGDWLKIILFDDGKGISPENIKKVGKGFTNREGGSGLGTQIIRQSIESVRGDVTWNSKTNVGTSVIIRIPK